MKITRLYSGDDGESHFEDITVSLKDAGDIGRLSEVEPVTGIIFRENDAEYDFSWHNAPRRQYIISLDGEIEIEAGDGNRRQFGAGDIILAEDTTGRGHKSRHIKKSLRRSIFVTLD